MKKILLLLPVLYAGFLCSCNQGGSGDAYNIQMRLNKGDSFHQEIVMNMEMGVAGIETKTKMNTNCSFEVIKNDSSGKELKITYNKMHMAIDMGKLNSANNMNKMTDSIMDETTKLMVGKSVVLKLTKDNEITDVQGFDEVINTGSDSLKREMVKKMFSKDQVNTMFGMTFSIYPNKPVRVGDSWNGKKSLNMGGIKMDIDYKYTLKSVKDGLADIDMDGTIGGNGEISQMNTKVKMDMEGKQKGTITLRMDNGYTTKADFKTDANMKMDVMGQKLIMKMKMDMTINGL